MQMLRIEPSSNGAHDNQTCHGFIPDGWAVIPDDMGCENFPFGEVEVAEIDGVMTVTKWIPGVMPEPTPMPEPEPTTEERVKALEKQNAELMEALELLLSGDTGEEV